ncbi:MAG: ATP-dependent metallopeptidase FtsH/Yme1/Tma family protein, partial [Lachnospiraceae bacterium]|nr:ATP-dependent metallopeptidase FtsH/Yme1/Tma family protein [Lachnospiraceae bacterium]
MEPNKNNNRKRSSFSSIIIIIIIAIIGVIVFNTIFSSIKASRRNEISYDEFLTIIESGDV